MATQSELRDALNRLSSCAQHVFMAESAEGAAEANHRAAQAKLKDAQTQYDEALENAKALFPHLTTGFHLQPPETVAIGADGQVHVVPMEAL